MKIQKYICPLDLEKASVKGGGEKWITGDKITVSRNQVWILE